MKESAPLSIVIGLLVAILGIVGYKLSPMRRQNTDVTLPVSTCSPGLQTCTLIIPNGRQLDFSMEPLPIRPLQTLRLIVAVSGTGIQKVEVDFDGTEMNMGYNRVALSENKQQFSGQAILPVCISGTMTWTATVLLTTETQRIAVPFHFAVAGH